MRSLERLIVRKQKRFPIEIGIIQSVSTTYISVYIPIMRKTAQCAIPSFMKQQIRIPQYSISASLPAADIYINRFNLEDMIGHRVVVLNPRTHPQIGAIWEV